MAVKHVDPAHAHPESEDTCWLMLVILLGAAVYAVFLLLSKCGFFG